MNDTSPDAQARQIEALRRLTGEERLQLAMDMCEMARESTLARLRSRHPDWSEATLRRELIRYAFLPGQVPARLR